MPRSSNVRLVRLQFNDIHGVTKNVAIPVGELDSALEGKVAFDGSCIEGFVRHEESDMYLAPDPSTFAVLPTLPAAPPEARLLCDVYNPDGSPFEGCTRSTLRRVLEEIKKEGFSAHAGAELEFFLFEHARDGQATTLTSDRGSYFDLSPIDRGDLARCDIALALEGMGIRVEATHHEVSRGQHEIDLGASDALALADAVATARVVVKTVAARHDLHATFMPKPFANQDGSGLHLAQFLRRDESNAFYEPHAATAGLSETGLSYIGGLARARARIHARHESDSELVQAARARLRRAVVRAVVAAREERAGPRSGASRQRRARRAALPGSVLQSLPCAGLHLQSRHRRRAPQARARRSDRADRRRLER